MAAYRRVYDSRHLQADYQEPGSAPEPYTLGNRVWAAFYARPAVSSSGAAANAGSATLSAGVGS